MGKTATKTINREKVFESICKATRMDTLGLFIGSGFSKALMENHPYSKTYSWAELLQKAADDMGITRRILNEGKPYPEVASVLCQEYVRLKSVSYQEAERTLKFKIADLVNISPTEIRIDEYGKIFSRMSPNWIITTNYDSIIEQILHEKAFPIIRETVILRQKTSHRYIIFMAASQILNQLLLQMKTILTRYEFRITVTQDSPS